jgi:hypothetical protein
VEVLKDEYGKLQRLIPEIADGLGLSGKGSKFLGVFLHCGNQKAAQKRGEITA